MKILILFFLLFISCKEKPTVTKIISTQILVDGKELPTFFTYGLPFPEGYLGDENQLTIKYGFQVKRVAGCEYSQKLIDDCNLNNKKVINELNEIFGENWLKKFEDETGLNTELIPGIH